MDRTKLTIFFSWMYVTMIFCYFQYIGTLNYCFRCSHLLVVKLSLQLKPIRYTVMKKHLIHFRTFVGIDSPLADSFLVLMILAAYSWPVLNFTHRRTTENAPLGKKNN